MTAEKIDPIGAEQFASSDNGSLKDARIMEASSPADSVPEIDGNVQKAVYRKVDFRILLWYSLVYLIMRIHVSNITNTAIVRTAGL